MKEKSIEDIIFDLSTETESVRNYIYIVISEQKRFNSLTFWKRLKWLFTGKF